MSFLYKDRVLDTTTTTGTGDLTLAGAVTGYQAGSVIGDGNQFFYSLWGVGSDGNPSGDWETGIGQYTTSGSLVSRLRVLANSNGTPTLYDGLVSYWSLGEVSGSAIDAHGSNNLTETSGTIDSVAGKVGNGRDFELADTEYFERTSNDSLKVADTDFSFSCWIKFESIATDQRIISKGDGASWANTEYVLDYTTSTNRFSFSVGAGGTGPFTVTANTFGALSTGVWYHIIFWHDSVNNVIGISVNGTADTTSHSTGVNITTATFRLGASGAGVVSFDGILDEVGFWKKVLSSTEKTFLYNSGNGRSYSGLGDPVSLSAGTKRIMCTVPAAKVKLPDVQSFTTAGTFTWVKPPGCKMVEVILIGGGGGGGSGRKGATADAGRTGGGGGGGGGYCIGVFKADDLGAVESVVVGAAGTGGASQTTNSTNGNSGSGGGASTFGAWLRAAGGTGGGIGQITGSAGGSGGGTNSLVSNAGSTAGGCTAVNGVGGSGENSTIGSCTGGGAGGGLVQTTDALGSAGAGGSLTASTVIPTAVAGGAAGTAGGAGGNGNTIEFLRGLTIGTGGGGGHGSSSTNAGAGGNGGNYGAGGGGGGASKDSTGDSGAGGNGASGAVIIISS